ncbi:hypothetical protein [Streptomyces sp. NPDC088812]|uniref:hypothetical protein n=1 Tax=Streptomyces sp. NPDC088812 TaxID=3365905 RepID=UPI00380138EB
MSSTRSLPFGPAWLRIVVLLLVVLVVPGTPTGTATAPAVAAAETFEFDALDTALRPTVGGFHRTVAPPPRSTPGRTPTPAVLPGRRVPPPHGAPYAPDALDALRTVVLRC